MRLFVKNVDGYFASTLLIVPAGISCIASVCVVCVKTTVEFWQSTVNKCTSYGSTDVMLLKSQVMGSVVIHSLQLTTIRLDTVSSFLPRYHPMF